MNLTYLKGLRCGSLTQHLAPKQVGYNKACSLVEAGDFAAAELELKLTLKQGACMRAGRSQDVCVCACVCVVHTHNARALLAAAGRETLFEEECSEREVEDELAPITVQLAYVLGRLGRRAEAQELHDKVTRHGMVRLTMMTHNP